MRRFILFLIPFIISACGKHDENSRLKKEGNIYGYATLTVSQESIKLSKELNLILKKNGKNLPKDIANSLAFLVKFLKDTPYYDPKAPLALKKLLEFQKKTGKKLLSKEEIARLKRTLTIRAKYASSATV